MRKNRSRWLTAALSVLAALAALSVNQKPAAAVIRVAEFPADCQLSHRLPDDPIVLPGLPGASHSHDFFGNHATDAQSDYTELAGSTGNCDPAIDISSYWVPTLYRNNQPVVPSIITFYYLGEGVNNPAAIKPTPVGLKIVAGNAKATGDADSIARWSCLHAGQVPPSKKLRELPGRHTAGDLPGLPAVLERHGAGLGRPQVAHVLPGGGKLPVVTSGAGAQAAHGHPLPGER